MLAKPHIFQSSRPGTGSADTSARRSAALERGEEAEHETRTENRVTAAGTPRRLPDPHGSRGGGFEGNKVLSVSVQGLCVTSGYWDTGWPFP